MIALLGAAGLTGIAGTDVFGLNFNKREFEAAALETSSGKVAARGNTKFKTIGVLGGIGPQATMEFELRAHAAAQRLIPPQQNAGYPPMIVYYHRHPPVLVDENFMAKLPIQPDPRFLEAAKRVGATADFLVVTSNGAHALQAEIERAADRKVLSMIDVTLAEIKRRGWKKVGVLGLGEPFVYTKPLEAMRIASEIIDGELRSRLDRAIFKVMEGRNDAELVGVGQAAIKTLRAKKVDGVILGCTELPVLLRESLGEADLLNPTELIAEAAVRFAIGERV
ncbi:MAG TPA: amino acid racemase [Pyrinomonadaceae bacterium]|jgi:aspartate racemase